MHSSSYNPNLSRRKARQVQQQVVPPNHFFGNLFDFLSSPGGVFVTLWILISSVTAIFICTILAPFPVEDKLRVLQTVLNGDAFSFYTTISAGLTGALVLGTRKGSITSTPDDQRLQELEEENARLSSQLRDLARSQASADEQYDRP